MNSETSDMMDAVRCSLEKEIECCNSSLQSILVSKSVNLNRSIGWWEGRRAMAKDLHDQILNQQLKGHL